MSAVEKNDTKCPSSLVSENVRFTAVQMNCTSVCIHIQILALTNESTCNITFMIRGDQSQDLKFPNLDRQTVIQFLGPDKSSTSFYKKKRFRKNIYFIL